MNNRSDLNRSEAAGFLGVSLAVVCAFWLRWPGLSPPSLWLDDLWELTLARADLVTVLTLPSHSPIGHRLALRWASDLAGIELGAQLPAFVCSLAAILLIALAGRTSSAGRNEVFAMILPAWLLATSTLGADLALRAKPYLADLALTATILWLLCYWREPGRRRALAWVGFCAAALLLSASASFAILAGAIALAWSWRSEGKLAVSLLCATVAELGLWWALQIRPSHGEALKSYWEQNHPSLSALPGAMISTLAQWLEDLLRLGPWSLLLGLIAIAVWLFHDRRSPAVHATCLLFGGIFLAAVLGIYPLGSGRVDLLLTAPLALGVGRGLAIAAGDRSIRFQLASVAGLSLVLFSTAVPVSYPRQSARQVINELGECRDGVIGGNSSAAFGMAVYSGEPSEIEPSDLLSCGFVARPIPGDSTWVELDEELVLEDVIGLDALVLLSVHPEELMTLDRLLSRDRGRAEIRLIGTGAAVWCW